MTDTDNLPPVELLDMAAKAGPEWADWASSEGRTRVAIRKSIIAHARTLETLREALRLLRNMTDEGHSLESAGQCSDAARAFLAKHEPELVPVDPDEEALNRILNEYAGSDWSMQVRVGNSLWDKALAQFKKELGRA